MSSAGELFDALNPTKTIAITRTARRTTIIIIVVSEAPSSESLELDALALTATQSSPFPVKPELHTQLLPDLPEPSGGG